MKTLYTLQSTNIRKTWIIFVIFLIIVIGLGWVFSYVYNDSTILYVAVIFSVLMNVVAYWNSDKIALSLAKAHLVTQESHKELFRIVENLCISQGMPMPKIYIIDDPSANAFATGRNPIHASLAITQGLLDILDRSELEGVIAHELSHIKNYDILVGTVVVVLVGFISIVADIFMRTLWLGGGRSRDNKQSNPIMLIVAIGAAILAPIAATLIQLAISRKREYLADASGALMTRFPQGLASALEKISKTPPLKKVSSATAHLYLVSPLRADSQNQQQKIPFLARLFMTHPPIEDRIKALQEAS